MTEFEPEIIFTKVVGVSFEGRQQILQTIERLKATSRDKVKFFLKPEPENKFDPCAVAVFVEYFDSSFLSSVTRQVGYISRDFAQSIAEDLKQGYAFEVLDFDTTGGKFKKSRGLNIKILRKEANMPTITALDLLERKSGQNAPWLKLGENSVVTLRFLKPLAEAFIDATYSVALPNGKREYFLSPQYVNGVGDDTIYDPMSKTDCRPWTKMILPCIDRKDNTVKLFRETVALFKKFKMFEEEPKNDLEKMVKLGGVTNADITIIQQGKGKERQINVVPVAGTIRPLTAEEKKLPLPNPKDFLRVLTVAEIEAIAGAYIQGKAQLTAVPAQNMAIRGPFSQ